MQRLIKVDGKVRTDINFPAGFMGMYISLQGNYPISFTLITFNNRFVFLADTITIEKTGEHFRLIYDVKGRFTIHRISSEEAKVNSIKSCRNSSEINVFFFINRFAVQIVQS